MFRGLRMPSLLVGVAVVLGACVPEAGATFEQGVEQQPGPGYIHLVTQPATAEIELTFRLIVGGEDSSRTTTIAAGEVVDVDLTTLPGAYGMRMNGTACDGRFPVEAERVTDVVVRITANGCAMSVGAIRDAEEMRPP